MRAWFNKNLPSLLDKEVNSEIYNDFLQFDGNSQTLRLVTKLQIINDNFGLNLTYATLAALIKYPRASYSSDKHWKKHGFSILSMRLSWISGSKRALAYHVMMPVAATHLPG
ncbi:putative deoxyguanosinetriphosphate triphosphohydrolase [Escherichia coli]|nr:putative deoxyguanosinetriphosphate triphosphohydrolase [Escherichia coli]